MHFKFNSLRWTLALALFVAVVATGCSGGGSAHSTPSELAESVFAGLQKEDVNSISPFLPGLKDLRESYDSALEKLGEEKVGKWDEAKVKGAADAIKGQMNALWNEVHSAGTNEGIDWKTAQQKGLTEKSNAFVESANSHVAEVELAFESGEQSYTLLVGSAKYSRGWLLARLSLGK